MAGGESKTPRSSMAHAVILVPIRVTVFYLISVVFIGILVSPSNKHLFGGTSAASSPFVIAINEAGIKGLPDFFNAVIVVSVSAIGAEGFYLASRILHTISYRGLIFPWIAKVDSKGRPRIALLITGLLAIALTYINLSAGGTEVFNWLAQITSTGFFMDWFVIGITSFRFRAALKAQNDPLFNQTYAWKCALWPLPPIWLLSCCLLYIGSSFYLALYPIVCDNFSLSFFTFAFLLLSLLLYQISNCLSLQGTTSSDKPTAYGFFQYMFGLILIVGSGIIYKIVFRTKIRPLESVDLVSGRGVISQEEIQELDDFKSSPWWKKVYSYVQLW